jgi:large subunit ribosomal protein L10
VPELRDTNVLLWGDDVITPCKIADKSAAQFKEHFKMKAGLIEGKIAPMEDLLALAKLPSRDELLGMLLNVWNAPITNFTIGLKALADKKAEEEA